MLFPLLTITSPTSAGRQVWFGTIACTGTPVGEGPGGSSETCGIVTRWVFSALLPSSRLLPWINCLSDFICHTRNLQYNSLLQGKHLTQPHMTQIQVSQSKPGGTVRLLSPWTNRMESIGNLAREEPNAGLHSSSLRTLLKASNLTTCFSHK